MMFKVLVVQAANNLSGDRTEFLINGRLSFMRFLGLTLAGKAPDAKTIWAFRERLTRRAPSRVFLRRTAINHDLFGVDRHGAASLAKREAIRARSALPGSLRSSRSSR